jgi:hypothetical protein
MLTANVEILRGKMAFIIVEMGLVSPDSGRAHPGNGESLPGECVDGARTEGKEGETNHSDRIQNICSPVKVQAVHGL